MNIFNRLRTSFQRKSNKTELTLSEQIEKLFHDSNRLVDDDHCLQLLRQVYDYRRRQFDALNIPFNDLKRIEFERSILKSLFTITSNLPSKPQSVFQRSSNFYRSMPIATSIRRSKQNNRQK